jgi:hypothetical protein
VETKVADFTISFDQFNQQAFAAIVMGVKLEYPDAKFKKVEDADLQVTYEVFLHGE